jgi:hypothetical protein
MNDIYGAPPIDLGLFDIAPKEMMFWLYCPVKLPGHAHLTFPPNLEQFRNLVAKVSIDILDREGIDHFIDSYFYLTAKTLFVTADNPGNRPGWHSDGFMTDDLNYVWSDCNGTLFWEPQERGSFIQDEWHSLSEMAAAAFDGPVKSYPDKHLLRLDQSVIHRVADVTEPRVRTFVKVSVSRDKYNLVGNSVNHQLAPDWTYFDRSEDRNVPTATSKEPEVIF